MLVPARPALRRLGELGLDPVPANNSCRTVARTPPTNILGHMHCRWCGYRATLAKIRLFSWRDVLTPPHSAAMSNYACQSQTGSKASDELFIACREPATDAARRRRGSSRILLCSATCLGVYESRRLRPALAHKLNDDRRKTFSTLFQFHLCRNISSCQHCRQKA